MNTFHVFRPFPDNSVNSPGHESDRVFPDTSLYFIRGKWQGRRKRSGQYSFGRTNFGSEIMQGRNVRSSEHLEIFVVVYTLDTWQHSQLLHVSVCKFKQSS